jgi:hypothetical protein
MPHAVVSSMAHGCAVARAPWSTRCWWWRTRGRTSSWGPAGSRRRRAAPIPGAASSRAGSGGPFPGADLAPLLPSCATTAPRTRLLLPSPPPCLAVEVVPCRPWAATSADGQRKRCYPPSYLPLAVTRVATLAEKSPPYPTPLPLLFPPRGRFLTEVTIPLDMSPSEVIPPSSFPRMCLSTNTMAGHVAVGYFDSDIADWCHLRNTIKYKESPGYPPPSNQMYTC